MSEAIRFDKLDKVVLDNICAYVFYNGDLRKFASVCSVIRKFVKKVYLPKIIVPDGYYLCAGHYRIEECHRYINKCTHCELYYCNSTVDHPKTYKSKPIICLCQKCIHADIYTTNDRNNFVLKSSSYGICINCRSTCPVCKNYKPITQKYCGKKKCCVGICYIFPMNKRKNTWYHYLFFSHAMRKIN